MKRLFLAYAREDATAKNRLLFSFFELQREGLVSIWNDVQGTPGEFAKVIERQIDASDIFMPLISPAFLNSDYCVNVELKRAAMRWKAGNYLITPVLLQDAPGWTELRIDSDDARLGKFGALPFGYGPILASDQPEHAYARVAHDLRPILARESGPPAVDNTLDDICVLVFDALQWCLDKDSWMHYYSDDIDAPADLHGTMDVQASAGVMTLDGYDNRGTRLETRSRIRWDRHLHRFTYNVHTPKAEQVKHSFVLRLSDNGRCSFEVESFHAGIASPAREMKPQEMVAFIRDEFREQKRQHRPRKKPRPKSGKKPRR
jgi:hypothetical protein